MTWFNFFLAQFLILLILYGLGFPYAKALGLRTLTALCISPIVSIFIIVLFSELYARLGVFSSFFSLAIPILLLGLALLVASLVFRRSHQEKDCVDTTRAHDMPRIPCNLLLLCLAISYIAVTWIFVKNLDGPGSILQANDNVHHLGMMYGFAISGDYSSIGYSLYPLSTDIVPYEVSSTSFYPSAWHAIGAMVINLAGLPTSLVANALNATLAGIVFPASMFALLSELFTGNKLLLLASSIVMVSFGAFPWEYLVFGPLYPNLLSFAIVPIAALAFVTLCKMGISITSRIKAAVIFVLSLVSLVFSQTNAVFTLGMFLAPYCVYRSGDIAPLHAGDEHFLQRNQKLIIRIVAAVIIACIWYVAFKLPFIQNVVTYNWSSTISKTQAIVNVLFLAMTKQTTAQPLLGFLVLVGIVYTLGKRQYLWLSFSYALAALAYVLSSSTEGFLKQLLSGFWYTDPQRLAAMVGLFGIPLAALGVYSICKLACRLMPASEIEKRAFDHRIVVPALLVTITASLFFPSFSVSGIGEVITGFGSLSKTIFDQNSAQSVNVLDEDERVFAEEALSIIPEGSLIINQPNDGSAFLYPLYGANLYYRDLFGPGSKETDISSIIRQGIDEVGIDPEVREATEAIGARYILILDMGGASTPDRRFLSRYNPETWEAINSIDDETPGLNMLLSEGDMRLYEIVS